MYRILIAENIPSLNKGEETILDGMLESFRLLGEVKVSMVSDSPEIDIPRYGHKIEVINLRELFPLKINLDRRFNRIFTSFLVILQHLFFLILYKLLNKKALLFTKAKIWQTYLNSDVIIVGHDGVFGLDFYGPICFYIPFISLFTKMLNKPCVFYGGSISLRASFIKKILRFFLDKMDLITLREDISYENLKEYKLRNKKVFVTADPAILLKPSTSKRVEEIMNIEGISKLDKPLIGFTVTKKVACHSSLRFSDINKQYHNHIQTIAQTVDNIIEKFDATVIFVPHCIGPGNDLDDRIIYKDIFQICRRKENIKIIINEYSAAELKGLIGRFDLFIGERIHSVVNAMTMHVPSIVLSLSNDKRLGIINMFNQENIVCHVEMLTTENLISKIEYVWQNKLKIENDLKTRVKEISERSLYNAKLLKKVLNNKPKINI